MVESTGGGAAWLDFDRDGTLDLYLCQGGHAKSPPPADQPLDVLYRGTPQHAFRSVAPSAGVREPGYGQGVSAADFDDDGFDDVYVTNVGNSVLWRNCGDGTFEDVTAATGVASPGWSTSSAWGDLDGDGDLDLYVCHYAIYDVHNPRVCTDGDGRQAVCDPLEVDAEPDVCYENLGDGGFRDVTAAWGFDGVNDRSLGVVIVDINADGRQDVFVANDVSANFLYINDGPAAARRFRETGVIAGVAMNALGDYQASMGVALGDYDADGRPDLYCTHFTDDSNTLYRNLGGGMFEDVTRFVDLHQPTLPYLGFGTVFEDFNADGRMDVLIANGHIDDWRSRGKRWKMTAQQFTFDGERFHDSIDPQDAFFQREVLGRAVALGDFDRDGDGDLCVVHQHDSAALLRNDSPAGGHWLAIEFTGRTSNRRGIGAQVTVRCGDVTRSAWLAGGTSYCAGQEPVVRLGLGPAAGPCELTVVWPSGVTQTVRDVAVDQRLTLIEPATTAETGP